ncbi:MAG: hypothetical protein ABIT07_00465 [Ferruginibacter sp.]
MSACNFTIPFTSSPENVMQKAKATILGQGGNFNGNETAGNFSISIFGNTVIGSYTVNGQELTVLIEEKPFLIPCNSIESFLKSKLN